MEDNTKALLIVVVVIVILLILGFVLMNNNNNNKNITIDQVEITNKTIDDNEEENEYEENIMRKCENRKYRKLNNSICNLKKIKLTQ